MGRGASEQTIDRQFDEIVRSALPPTADELRVETLRERREVLTHVNDELKAGNDRFRWQGSQRRAVIDALCEEELSDEAGEFLMRLIHKDLEGAKSVLPQLPTIFYLSGAVDPLTPYLAVTLKEETKEWQPRRGSNGVNSGGGHYETRVKDAAIHIKAEAADSRALCGCDIETEGAYPFFYRSGFAESKNTCRKCSALWSSTTDKAMAEAHRRYDHLFDDASEEEPIFVATLDRVRRRVIWRLKQKTPYLPFLRDSAQEAVHHELANQAVSVLYCLDEKTRWQRLLSLPPTRPSLMSHNFEMWEWMERDLDRLASFCPQEHWSWPDQKRAAEILLQSIGERPDETTGRMRFLLALAQEACPEGFADYRADTEASALKSWISAAVKS